MPPKRSNIPGEPSAQQKKKLRVDFARTIPVQNHSQGSNATTGPLNAVTPNKGLQGLPSAIDVEKFAEARAFEIDAMQKSMKSVSGLSTHRAWQVLPRHLRRRAASHDVRRVPSRLRDKARSEMDATRKKALGRSMPKCGISKRKTRTESFLKRQRDKKWLETHIWHAKRMKMDNMWGYRLAVHPTEKSYRPSHRASIYGSILHDASYFSLLEISGPQKIVISILELICDPQGPGPGSQRFIGGSRTLDIHAYSPGHYPFDLIGSMTVLWKPVVQPSAKPDESRKVKASEISHARMETYRTVWLRFHPVISEPIVSALRCAGSDVLAKANEATENAKVDIIDLTGQINVFEIMGPKANQVIKGSLTPESQDKRDDFNQFWTSLGNLQTSGQIPRSMVIGFNVVDPRLKFPPKNAKIHFPNADQSSTPLATFPCATLARSDIWEQSSRSSLATPRFKKKDLDERRSKMLIPGTYLPVTRQDDRIPVLLIQRSLETSPGSSSTQAIHGWTLIIPAGWAMVFLNSLTFTGTRVGGQRERQTQAFESGTPYFPRDFPSTSSYNTYADKHAESAQEKWNRRPPAKRVNYEMLGTLNPWKADWNRVLGIEQDDDAQAALVTTQREDPETCRVACGKPPVRSWLLRADVTGIVYRMSTMLNPGAGLLSEINRLRVRHNLGFLDATVKADDLLQGALVTVRLDMCKRGAPDDLAMIYMIDDLEAKRWERALTKNHARMASGSEEETEDERNLSKIKPLSSSIIGYITTGHFSLSRGQGFAIGAIPASRFLDLQQQDSRLNAKPKIATHVPKFLVKVRNINGEQCRAGRLRLLDG